ncbi:NhaP-type Na+/H+ or K+/H+ antiporter [Lewinella marina]|uniref:Cell shape-determining protein n=1 Tax=Neolewinella marina TaxID=438751 RepID=A0A2G0CD00_9BACT|nr:sodium:proton antiporter [Neolewinella marina]NJB86996.1 NhaP-type Na+/H+ or K+/H+ antiporter [Neolewinella marina]PHK97810.1 cell shape-determining protein [Neolewinella marina]
MYEIGSLIIIGVVAQWIAWRLRVPAILPLILAGILIGPGWELYTGHRLLSPRFDSDAGTGLFPGNLLYSFVSLSIGLILFEGGLTLKLKEIRGLADSILRLTTYGALTTTVIAGLAAHYVLGLNWQIAFLFSTLIVVTGPTVIAPIMRQINVKRQVATVLKWESIVIDPLGAFLAVLFYNFILAYYDPQATVYNSLIKFLQSGLVGIGLGFVLGRLLFILISRLYIPKFLLNIVTLGFVVGAFLLSDAIAHESGLLTTVVMGAYLANREVPYLHDILDFKESLTLLLISLLFILLSANMTVEQIRLVLNQESLVVFLIVVFLARPLGVFWSLRTSELGWRDKAFISWVGPRGIVAAGVASLFGIELAEEGITHAEYITPLVFLIVLGTVLLNATLAGFLARKLKVSLPKGSGVVIFGASEGARQLAHSLVESGRDVTLVTGNRAERDIAQEQHLTTIQVQFNSDLLDSKLDLTDIGYVLALTGNDEDNFYLLNNYRSREGIRGAYRLVTRKEIQAQRFGPEALFGHYVSYLLFNRAARNFGTVNAIQLLDPDELPNLIAQLREERAIPLYLRCTEHGDITFIPAGDRPLSVSPGDTLYYIGEPLPSVNRSAARQLARPVEA